MRQNTLKYIAVGSFLWAFFAQMARAQVQYERVQLLFQSSAQKQRITAIAEHQGQIWLATEGAFLRLSIDTAVFPNLYKVDTLYDAQGANFVGAALYVRDSVEQWVADYEGNLYEFRRGKLRDIVLLPALQIQKIQYDSAARLLLLACQDAQDFDKRHYRHLLPKTEAKVTEGDLQLQNFSALRTEDFLLDSKGGKWLAHGKGLTLVQEKKTVEISREPHYKIAAAPKGDKVWAIFLRNNANYLRAYSLTGKPLSKEIRLPDDNQRERVQALAIDAWGRVLLASNSANFVYFDAERQEFLPVANAAQIAKASASGSSQRISQILPIQDGSFWLNTSAGLFHFGRPRKEPRRDSADGENQASKEVIVLKNIQFESEDSTLLPASFEELRFVVERLQKDPNLQLTIKGHTAAPMAGINPEDAREHLLLLSEARARAVANYLMGKGISSERLHCIGLGFGQPLFSADPQNARNRRVELEFQRKDTP